MSIAELPVSCPLMELMFVLRVSRQQLSRMIERKDPR
jgi:hypothetical protein